MSFLIETSWQRFLAVGAAATSLAVVATFFGVYYLAELPLWLSLILTVGVCLLMMVFGIFVSLLRLLVALSIAYHNSPVQLDPGDVAVGNVPALSELGRQVEEAPGNRVGDGEIWS